MAKIGADADEVPARKREAGAIGRRRSRWFAERWERGIQSGRLELVLSDRAPEGIEAASRVWAAASGVDPL